MAFYNFSVGIKKYKLNQLDEDYTSHDALFPLSSNAKLYCLVNTTDLDRFVAYIVGDICSDDKREEYAFAVIEEDTSSSADKIAIQRVLQYLNNIM